LKTGIIALLLNLVSLYLHFTGNFLQPTPDANLATLTWFLSLILFGIAIFLLPFKSVKQKHEPLNGKEKLLFFLLLLLGLALRLYKIKHQGIYLDEWYWVTNAKSILDGTIQTPFGFIGDQPSNMPAYIVALFYSLTHDVYLAVRLPGVLFSIGTMCFVFLFLKEAYNKKAALLSTLLLATSIWDIHMSQLGWNNVSLNPFLISGTLYFLYRSIKNGSLRDAFLCGIFLGISINLLYIATLSVLVVAVFWLYRMIFLVNRKVFVLPLIIFSITTFMTMSPTIAKIVRYPEQSIKRHQEFLQQNENYSKQSSGMFYYVDQIKLAASDLQYNQDKYNIVMLWGITIEPIILLFFLLGVLYMLRHIKYFPNSIVLLDYIVMLIPIVVLYRFTSIWREYGFVPSLYIIASLGAYIFLQAVIKVIHFISKHETRAAAISFAVIAVLYIAQWTYYFHNYYLISLKNDPVMYETVCKNTTTYIEKNIPQQTTLYFPNELCTQLITVVLDEKYHYTTYNTLEDLQNPASRGHRAIIVFTKNQVGASTNMSSVLGASTSPDGLASSAITYSTYVIKGADDTVGAIIYTQ